jgi:hypothetical protein
MIIYLFYEFIDDFSYVYDVWILLIMIKTSWNL